jgi:hypothetical protein
VQQAQLAQLAQWEIKALRVQLEQEVKQAQQAHVELQDLRE